MSLRSIDVLSQRLRRTIKPCGFSRAKGPALLWRADSGTSKHLVQTDKGGPLIGLSQTETATKLSAHEITRFHPHKLRTDTVIHIRTITYCPNDGLNAPLFARWAVWTAGVSCRRSPPLSSAWRAERSRPPSRFRAGGWAYGKPLWQPGVASNRGKWISQDGREDHPILRLRLFR
jgi:hypothetical protein